MCSKEAVLPMPQSSSVSLGYSAPLENSPLHAPYPHLPSQHAWSLYSADCSSRRAWVITVPIPGPAPHDLSVQPFIIQPCLSGPQFQIPRRKAWDRGGPVIHSALSTFRSGGPLNMRSLRTKGEKKRNHTSMSPIPLSNVKSVHIIRLITFLNEKMPR